MFKKYHLNKPLFFALTVLVLVLTICCLFAHEAEMYGSLGDRFLPKVAFAMYSVLQFPFVYLVVSSNLLPDLGTLNIFMALFLFGLNAMFYGLILERIITFSIRNKGKS